MADLRSFHETLYDEVVTEVLDCKSWPGGAVNYCVRLAGYGSLWFPVEPSGQRPQAGDAVVAHVPVDYGVVYVVPLGVIESNKGGGA